LIVVIHCMIFIYSESQSRLSGKTVRVRGNIGNLCGGEQRERDVQTNKMEMQFELITKPNCMGRWVDVLRFHNETTFQFRIALGKFRIGLDNLT
jgi:hypothetical protein